MKVKLEDQNFRRDSVSLSDYYSDNEPNDMDFNEIAQILQYRHAIKITRKNCENLSKDNEKLVRRYPIIVCNLITFN